MNYGKSTSDENLPISPGDHSKPKKIHYMAVLAAGLSKLGDSVETYLPSVITQPVSCDLQLSKSQEDILALSLYVSLGVFSFITMLFLVKLPRRLVILASLYFSIVSTAVCSLVPNYTSLLISRVVVGMGIAANMISTTVYIAEISPSKEFLVVAVIISSIGWTVGGGWCGFLGYLLLEPLGWRWFVSFTSIPLFIFPVIAFQFFLPETKDQERVGGDRPHTDTTMMEECQTKLSVMVLRTVKLQLYNISRTIPITGAILLLPAILKADNIRNSGDSSCHAIHGTQFLWVTLLFGVSHLLGRGISFLLQGRMKPQFVMLWCSVTCSVSTGLILIPDENTVLVMTCLAVVQLALACAETELNILTDDRFFFTPKFLPISSGLRITGIFVMTVFSSFISQLLPYNIVIMIHFGASLMCVFCCILLFFKE